MMSFDFILSLYCFYRARVEAFGIWCVEKSFVRKRMKEYEYMWDVADHSNLFAELGFQKLGNGYELIIADHTQSF
ncbi:MAG: hypothetical protein J0L83_14495 [Chitinophagales bacterium]|nr:hypothetical protein [Chitinophagales bacterium]